jgi:hypothetical protein
MALTTFYYSDRAPTTSSNTIITSSSRPASTNGVLTSVVIGDTVTSIANNAFDTCENLLSVGFILPSVLTTIGYQAFADCYALEEINLPDSVTTIEGQAFNGTNIDSFYVSANLITIGDNALTGGKFGNFIVDNNNPNYSNGSLGELFNKNKTTLIQYANKRIDNSYTIPDSVTTIGSGALQLSNNLTRINFTNNITIITPYSVASCANLTEIYIGKGLTNIGFNAFDSCTNLIKVIFIGNAPSLGSNVFLNTNANLKVYRYSTRSGWSSTFGGKDVLLIDAPSKGLRTFGFSGLSSGQASIKKQKNLSILKGQGFYPESEVIYIFKSAVNNTLGSIFNYLQFDDYVDFVNLYYEGSLSGQSMSFVSDGSNWIDFSAFENADNYVIPANSIIIINLSSDKNITVGGGAIIQKYYSGKINLNTYIANDPDARNYISAVEAADGSPLEASVKKAIDNFIIGCKSDGIWTAIKASCLLAGAKTLNGALVPLVGTAPTSNNFVAGDYSRTLGLLGDGSTKSLSTGYVSNTFFQQDNLHLSVYVTSAPASSGTNKVFLGNASLVPSRVFIAKNTLDQFSARLANAGTAVNVTEQGTTTGFKGGARSSSTAVIARSAQTNTSTSITSATIAANLSISVFAGGGSNFCDARISFYSMGENIDLQKLDNRVTDYINAISSI